MQLKKRVFAVAAVVAMTASVVYGSTINKDEAAISEQLMWLSNKETIYCWYNDESLSNYINMAAVSFGEKEEVRVIPVLRSDEAYLEAINQASMTETQVPDVYIASNDYLEKAYLAGLTSPIQDPAQICNEEHFPKAALDAVSYHGQTVAYPMFYDTSVLVYNDTFMQQWAQQQAEKSLNETYVEGEHTIDPVVLLDQRIQEYRLRGVPDTVAKILNIADSYDAPDTIEGIMKWDVSDIFYNYWAIGGYTVVGGDTGDDEASIDITNENIKACLEVYKDMSRFFSIEPDTVDYESVVQDFIEGKCVFTIASTDIVGTLRQAQADGGFPYEFKVCTMPEISEQLASRSLSLTSGVVINGYSTHKEIANKFASYLVDEFAPEMYQRTGKLSANSHINAEDEALSVCMEEYATSVSIPKMMSTGNFWLQAEILFSKIWNGGDIPTLLQELHNQITGQINQNP